ncbi:MAG: phosphate/phosphite/phosphonate ABC transporter substrate-binding protein [Candidatus Thiodiazotropha sp. (ex Lucina pensylvanica)]|nr:phosphate/phosphite/phosphonate ABC transporter substrate-binding protein [Candidatus Thiodiazotropha sp. (ex Lucina pensylvanica)]
MQKVLRSRLEIGRLIRIAAFFFVCISTAAHSTDSLILGIHPYRSHDEIREMFTPLAEFLSQRIGQSVEVRIGESYKSHINAIIQGQLDLAYIGPALLVQLKDMDFVPHLLARLEIDGKSTFTGKIFTREGSDIRTLMDLKGRHFAFGSSSSTMSHLVPRQVIFEAGIDVDDLASYNFYSSHDNVALAVLAGDADAGAVKEAVFDKYHHKGIVAIATTPEISEHLFIAPADTNPDKVRLLRQQLLSLTTDSPETNQVLYPIKKTATALVSVEEDDYKKLRDVIAELRARGVVK